MAEIIGTSGSDILSGTEEDDVVRLGSGTDRYNDSRGNDEVYGENGNDVLNSFYGSDSLYGGIGADTLNADSYWGREARDLLLDGGDGDDTITTELDFGSTIEAIGGLGNDSFQLRGTNFTGFFSGGEGDDYFDLYLRAGTQVMLSLGEGRDTILVQGSPHENLDGILVISDFATGDLGDSIDLYGFAKMSDWSGLTNPFGEGYLELVQVGSDTILLADAKLDGNTYALVTFQNTTVSDFTYANLGHNADGTVPSVIYWIGTDERDLRHGSDTDDDMSGRGGDDGLFGHAGNDILRGEDGDDGLYGDEGDDILYGGAGSDSLNGGSGDNQLYGGEGADNLYFDDAAGGVTLLDGGNGNDDFYIDVSGESIANAFGGGNNDSFWLEGTRGTITADGGQGNDLFVVRTKMSAIELTMGDGVDTLRFGYFYTSSADACVTITDFATGEGGDYVDVSNYLDGKLPNFDATANPFRTGYVQLVQMGADTHLQYAGDLSAETVVYTTMAIFQNTSVADFGYDNFGFTPDGSGIPGITWEGTSGADTFDGSKDDDNLSGLAGDDTLRGNSGDDEIYGGDGNDVIEGGNDYDTLYGNAGSDQLVSTAGNDLLFGGDGNDILTITTQSWAPAAEVHASGGNGDDILSVDLRNEDSVTLIGGLGNDKFYLSGTGGTVLAQGGAGADFYNLELGATRVTLVLGADQDVVRLAGLDASDFTNQVTITDFATGDEGDRVNFRTFLETIVRTWDRAGDPFAQGLVQIVQVGADSHLQFASSSGGDFTTAVVFKNTTASEFTSYNLDYASFSEDDIPGESWTGTESDDDYTGSEYADDLTGLGGDDTIRGGYGNDVIRGGDGNDYLIGDYGNDVLFGGAGADELVVWTGADKAFGEGGDDIIRIDVDFNYSVGTVVADGGWGNDYIEAYAMSYRTLALFGGGGNDTFRILGDSGVVNIDAGAGDDTLFLNTATTYRITLGEGADVVQLRYGGVDTAVSLTFTDFETGETGDFFDFLPVFERMSSIWDGRSNPFGDGFLELQQVGTDTHLVYVSNGYSFQNGTYLIAAFENTLAADFTAANLGFDPDGTQPEGVTWEGSWQAEDYEGTGGHDLLIGNAGHDTITAYSGDDTIYGGGGDDTISGGHGADLIFGGAGEDTILDSGLGGGRHYIDSGDGNDHVTFNQFGYVQAERATVILGGGDDYLRVNGSNAALNFVYGGGGADEITYSGDFGRVIMNGGGGDDLIGVALGGANYAITLGGGQDTIRAWVDDLAAADGALVITDFETGELGDRFELGAFFNFFDIGPGDPWNEGTGNAFIDQTARLIQRGDDALLQMAYGANGTFYTLAVLENVHVGEFVGSSELGYDPGTRSYYGTDDGQYLTGMWGQNFMFGYGGDDVMDGRAGNDVMDGGTGNDVLYGRTGDDDLTGGDGDDALFGADGDDRLTGGLGIDKLYADSGDDYLDGGAGDDEMGGGSGNDTMLGGDGNDTMRGKSGDDVMDGGLGADFMLGGYNNDTLSGGEGDDYLAGEAGDDILRGGAGIDKLFGHFGDDTLEGDAGADKMFGEGGDDTMHGGDDNDTMNGGSGRDIMYGDAGGDAMDGGDDEDTMHGGDGWDTLHGGNGWDTLYGDAGNDRLFGDSGNDIIDGGDDDDYIEGGDGQDSIDGGAGDDELHGQVGDDRIEGSFGNDVLLGHEGRDFLYGGAGNDILDGGIDNDELSGGDGDDLLYGGAGTDGLFGDAGADTIHGDAGGDYIDGGTGDDTLFGGDGGDTLLGNSGADSLDGGSGNDVIFGGLGNDTLTGGFGIDVFVMSGPLGGSNVDTITDFAAGTDGIVLDLSVFNGIASEGVLDAGAFRTGTSAGDSNDRIIYNKNTGEIFYDADGSGSGAKVLFAKVAAGTNLTASSFEAYYIQAAGEGPTDKLAASWAPAALPDWDLLGPDLPLL